MSLIVLASKGMSMMNTSSLPVGMKNIFVKSQPVRLKLGNRERILSSSIDLFNQSGVVAVTTNHIAAHLGISPGNLYFHFRNKEEIIFELFERMCDETYSVWKPSKGQPVSPLELIERSYETFWKYRFFHREMYHLRRKDPQLAKRWKTHIAKTMRLLQAMYAQWVKEGVMKRIDASASDQAALAGATIQMISDTVLITSSSFLQFFESPEKPATRRSLHAGLVHLLLFLLPYHTEPHQLAIQHRLRSLAAV